MPIIAQVLYYLVSRIALAGWWSWSLFDGKSKLRRVGLSAQNRFLSNTPSAPAPRVWVHCASLGEFEQVRPILEQLHQQKASITLSFFSPSGYELRKNYPLAYQVLYLPFDTPWAAKHFVNHIQPNAVIFVKYEIWYFYLQRLHYLGVPTFLIAAHFRSSQLFFKWYGGWYKQWLYYFTGISVQNVPTQQYLQQQGIQHTWVAGDPRADTVISISKTSFEHPIVSTFVGQSPVLIVGSTWQSDEAILAPFIYTHLLPKGWKVIVAPHHIEANRIQQIKQQFVGISTLLSEGYIHDKKILIIDNIGMLAKLYRYAHIAYIGGGFGSGIHNVLEAAVYGIPVFFGPNYTKFREAVELIERGGALCIEKDCLPILTWINDEPKRFLAGQIAQRYVYENKGATERIMKYIEPYIKDSTKE